MLKLGRSLLLLAAIGAGLGVLVNTLPWLQWLQQRTPMPAGTETRWLGFALVAGACLLARHELGRLQRAQQARELRASQDGQVFEARAGIVWFALPVVLCVVFGWSGQAALHKGQLGMAIIGFALLALFVLAGWQLVVQVLRPGPLLRMDRHGIDHAMYGPIPWREVVGIQLQSIRTRYSTQHTLMLGVRDAGRYLANAPPLTRWVHARRLRGQRGVAVLALPLNLLVKDADLVHAAARALRARDDAPFLDRWHARMEDHEVRALLDMQELAAESTRIAEEMAALPDDADPARLAAFEARLRGHRARHDAAMPGLRVAMDAQARRIRRDIRDGRWLAAAVLGLLLLSIGLCLMR
ncbi:MAG: hypothetical protein J7507_07570 [Pseudoxanthomonas sp.]|nr:hypothetical protein [Pseudoxanthomonas sp.]